MGQVLSGRGAGIANEQLIAIINPLFVSVGAMRMRMPTGSPRKQGLTIVYQQRQSGSMRPKPTPQHDTTGEMIQQEYKRAAMVTLPTLRVNT